MVPDGDAIGVGALESTKSSPLANLKIKGDYNPFQAIRHCVCRGKGAVTPIDAG
jgi:hypothetical protein